MVTSREQLAGGGVHDADLQALDEQQGAGSVDADVVEAAAYAEGDAAGVADLVGADTVVGVGGAVGAGPRLRSR